MDPTQVTVGFVTGRADELKSRWGERNTRMDDMEALYRLDVWEDEAAPDERRVTSPRPYTVVEATRALLFTQRPVIDVPASLVSKVADETASHMEKHLYGCWDRMRLVLAIDEAEFFADCLGMGVLRIVYVPDMPYGDLPIIGNALDPRHVYHSPDPLRPLRSMEVAHYFDRTRREIEAEWGELKGRPAEPEELAEWLDQEVDFIDYWMTTTVEREAKEEEEEILGPLGKAVKALRGIFKRPEEKAEEGEREGESERNVEQERAVINCVVADGQFVKEPMIVPGYEILPFVWWAGVRTPLKDEDSCLSVLWAIAGGVRGGGSQGMIATENELFSLKMREVERRARMAAVTNDESLLDLDSSPGAVNYAKEADYKITWVVPPGEGPQTDILMRQVGQRTEDATIPGSMMGQYQGAASGIALSMVTNPVLMRIAARQRDREEALQDVNGIILALTEEYAPDEGWTVWGLDKEGKEMEERLPPGMIAGYRRNRVHLSARLPRDAAGEGLMLSKLVQDKLLSRRSAIERLQMVLSLSGQSPDDELKRILIESILFDDEGTREAMAERALADYDQALAMAAQQAKAMEQGAMGPPGGPPGAGQGPMQGIPPEVVPPQAVPPAIGAVSPERMNRMSGPPAIPGG